MPAGDGPRTTSARDLSLETCGRAGGRVLESEDGDEWRSAGRESRTRGWRTRNRAERRFGQGQSREVERPCRITSRLSFLGTSGAVHGDPPAGRFAAGVDRGLDAIARHARFVTDLLRCKLPVAPDATEGRCAPRPQGHQQREKECGGAQHGRSTRPLQAPRQNRRAMRTATHGLSGEPSVRDFTSRMRGFSQWGARSGRPL
jgi:hypothetical protein